MNNQLNQIENGLNILKNKEAKIYFLTQDTDGTALASVAQIYQYVKYLKDSGYNAHILYEKKEVKGVSSWLSEEYSSLPHSNIEEGQLKVGPQDFVVIPELYGHVLEQIKDMPCTKLILCQAYDWALESLNPGFGWANYGVTKCITTTESQKAYIKSIFPSVETVVISPSIPEYFVSCEGPKKPIIAIHTRDHRDTQKIIKTFYLQNPQFKWVAFKDLRGMSRKDFATNLAESCISVWVDRTSGFGTFPIESMLCETPVVGVLPIKRPDWLTNENAIWVMDESKVVEVLTNLVKNWLEDTIPEVLYEKMKDTTKLFSMDTENKNVVSYFENLINQKITEFENSITKLAPVGEKI